MILVFDLDDTLYNEISFVKSGLLQVANFVSNRYNIQQQDAYEIMLKELLINGRGKIFNVLLKQVDVFSKSVVKECLSVYRLHKPIIKLNPDAERCLERFKDSAKYIVTDGNKIVQRNKVEALGLFPVMKKVFITHRYGVKNAKPSPYCFNRIVDLEKTVPENVLYIGDNPNKDFLRIKEQGFKTVRIRQGMFVNQILDVRHEAHISINTLDQLTYNFIKELNG